MGANSKIEWTDHTWNPWWGCSKVSAGCEHCYAERHAKRLGKAQWGPTTKRVETSDAYWEQPLEWDAAAEEAGERHRVFCGSMCDIFEDRPELSGLREGVFDTIDATPHLDWLLLTKRPENIARLMPPLVTQYVPEAGEMSYREGVRPNIWLGVSVEDQSAADQRIPLLLQCPAEVRFLSIEPLLGPITVPLYVSTCPHCGKPTKGRVIGGRSTREEPFAWYCERRTCGDQYPLPSIDWVIVGGESGPHARPMHPAWVRSIRDQCQEAGVPFFFKQWGEFVPGSRLGHPEAAVLSNGRYCFPDTLEARQQLDRELCGRWNQFDPQAMARVGKREAGRWLDGRTWDEIPRP
jgi:protein gp37